MRWSMLPVSIVVHAVVLGGFLVGPLALGLELPSPWLRTTRNFVMAAPAPPRAPVARPSRAATVPAAAPIRPPDRIADEVPDTTVAPSADGGLLTSTQPAGGIAFDLNVGAVAPPPPPTPPAERPAPVRVGGTIREPRKIVHVPAAYPEVARQVKIEGMVMIEATIDERGFVTDARVLRSKPFLDDAALAALRQWRYTPTLLNGLPVRVLMTITFNFKLTD